MGHFVNAVHNGTEILSRYFKSDANYAKFCAKFDFVTHFLL